MNGFVKKINDVPVMTTVTQEKLEKIFSSKENIGVADFQGQRALYSIEAADKKEGFNFRIIRRGSMEVLSTFYGVIVFVGGTGEEEYKDFEGTLPTFVTDLYVD